MQGYDSLLMKGQYPAAVLFLRVPYDEVDVNVHPAKFEVRFRRQSEVHDGLAHAIRAALRDAAKSPLARTPQGANRPEPFYVRESPLPYIHRTLRRKRAHLFYRFRKRSSPTAIFLL
jgi:DNA mismatch repair protein MutL